MARKLTEKEKDVLKSIKDAYIGNNEALTDKIEAVIGIPVKLTGKLLGFYESLGSTPLDEPTLAIDKSKYDDPTDFLNALNVAVEKMSELKEEDYKAEEFISFLMACHEKVNSFVNRDGSYKVTEKTSNQKFLTMSSVTKVKRIIDKAKKDADELYSDFDPDIDEASELSDMAIKIDEELKTKMRKLAYSVLDIKPTGLSEWEKDLLVHTMISSATDSINKSAAGRSL